MDDLISRQAAIDALDVLCQEHRYKIPGKRETYSPYNEAWQDALDRAEGAIGNLPSAQPEPCEDAVSRRRLLSDLKELTAAWGKYPVMAEQIKGVETAIGYVETIPSAQPEIIRCKDCKHVRKWRSEESAKKFGQIYECARGVFNCPKPEDFCSHAERRTDGNGRKEGTG